MTEKYPGVQAAIYKKYAHLFSDQNGTMAIAESDEAINKQNFDLFISEFKQQRCSTCGTSLKKYRNDRPCFHWLLFPDDMKKKYLMATLELWPFHDIQTYLRNVANLLHGPSAINDIAEQQDPKTLINYSIRINDVYYTFHLKTDDVTGHENQSPHYHLQIVDSRGYQVVFSDHPPLHPVDLRILSITGKTSNFHWGPDAYGISDRLGPQALSWISGDDDENKKDIDVYSAPLVNFGYWVDYHEVEEISKQAQSKNMTVPEYLEAFRKPKFVRVMQKNKLPRIWRRTEI